MNFIRELRAQILELRNFFDECRNEKLSIFAIICLFKSKSKEIENLIMQLRMKNKTDKSHAISY